MHTHALALGARALTPEHGHTHTSTRAHMHARTQGMQRGMPEAHLRWDLQVLHLPASILILPNFARRARLAIGCLRTQQQHAKASVSTAPLPTLLHTSPRSPTPAPQCTWVTPPWAWVPRIGSGASSSVPFHGEYSRSVSPTLHNTQVTHKLQQQGRHLPCRPRRPHPPPRTACAASPSPRSRSSSPPQPAPSNCDTSKSAAAPAACSSAAFPLAASVSKKPLLTVSSGQLSSCAPCGHLWSFQHVCVCVCVCACMCMCACVHTCMQAYTSLERIRGSWKHSGGGRAQQSQERKAP